MSLSLESPFLFLHDQDDVAVARFQIEEGVQFQVPGSNELVTTREAIEFGHKVAVRKIGSGSPVRKFGQIIGFATAEIEAGSWVHMHNLGMGELSQTYEMGVDLPPDPDPISGRTFQGIVRPDGRVATRNYVGIISTVNCSATASKYVADAINAELLADYPNIDGVVALTHKGGCASSSRETIINNLPVQWVALPVIRILVLILSLDLAAKPHSLRILWKSMAWCSLILGNRKTRSCP